jgi:hypothetical protein
LPSDSQKLDYPLTHLVKLSQLGVAACGDHLDVLIFSLSLGSNNGEEAYFYKARVQ